MNIQQTSTDALQQWRDQLRARHTDYCQKNITLDLTRGKPSVEQLGLSDKIDGNLEGNYLSTDGIDTRNYGGLTGLTQARQLGADILGVSTEECIAHGNSSLTLMFYAMLIAKEFGFGDEHSAWKHDPNGISILCPTPGYDRHYTICETLGINMVNITMTDSGPNMDEVEKHIASDPSIKGMWCVPKYSNPTGVIYSDETVERIAKLALNAHKNFRVFWDNAYAVHDLNGSQTLASIMDNCHQHGTQDSVLQFASTSKITHAGAGIAFFAASKNNLASFQNILGTMSIGPDKVNQLRHLRMIPDYKALLAHMEKHAAILKPRFDCVIRHLKAAFSDNDMGAWHTPSGGYFVSFDTQPGLAKTVVALAAEAGVKLTPAGATYPYGCDPNDCNIRIAPSVPGLEELELAMQIFVNCVKLASVEQALHSQQ